MITSLSVNRGGLGRAGNQMFTISSTIGIAVKNNQPFAFPEWINRDNALFGGNPDRMADYFVNPLPQLPEGLHFTDIPYHWEYRDYNIPDGNWNICSHLQDPRYFEHCMPLIRHYFRMKDEPEQSDCVAIHYRAGDYINDPAAYHPRCSKDYYEHAVRLFPEGTKFYLFSDAKYSELQSIFPMEIMDDTRIHHKSYLEDFAMMKRCKSFITANSSFSLFAAILGEHPDKKIVCPRRWFGEAAGGMRFEGYPSGAIIL